MLFKYYKENGWSQIIKPEDLDKPNEFLKKHFQSDKIQYMGHGGTCIAFLSWKDMMAIKVCIKKNDILKSGKAFMSYSNFLLDNGVKILEPKEILYSDDNFIIYSQEICSLLYSINTLSLIKILKIIMNLIDKRINIADLFHKNFGVYKNDVYIYDYHDQGYFYSNDRYYICHIAHLFSTYYYDKLFCGIELNTDILEKMEFGKGVFPETVVNILKTAYFYEFDKTIIYIKECIEDLELKVRKSYCDYQSIDIDRGGKLHLKGHTLDKFAIVKNLLEKVKISNFSLIDYGCSLGGIGSSVASLYPEAKIYLNNITKNELQICNEIVKNSLLMNVTITDINLVNDKNSYDICLYFAILHHILKHKTFDQVINIILKQIKKYAIIELPFGYDALLKKVAEDRSIDYDKSFRYLEDIDIFKNEICKYFEILDIIKIEYLNSPDLNRYAFVLMKL